MLAGALFMVPGIYGRLRGSKSKTPSSLGAAATGLETPYSPAAAQLGDGGPPSEDIAGEAPPNEQDQPVDAGDDAVAASDSDPPTTRPPSEEELADRSSWLIHFDQTLLMSAEAETAISQIVERLQSTRDLRATFTGLSPHGGGKARAKNAARKLRDEVALKGVSRKRLSTDTEVAPELESLSVKIKLSGMGQ